MKSEIDKVSALPNKRIFQSIVADYDLNRSICELIDNVLDIWTKGGRKGKVKVRIHVDLDQQTIRVDDNAGGVKASELNLIVAPGQTSNEPTDETIGLFGVGTKRAVVALAEEIKITTRYGTAGTYLVEIDNNWLKSDEWDLPCYQVDDIAKGTTIIELSKLRAKMTEEAKETLKEHLSATYSTFLKNKNVEITLNSEALEPIDFVDFAFPPQYLPQKHTGYIPADGGKRVKVEVLAGLTKQSNPESGEYGVYLYCNGRLIGRALKSYAVGFTKGLVGLPHFNISLARVIVKLSGEASLMPWNSSKSDINQNHPVFIALRDWLVKIVKYYASLSRRWQGEWDETVFRYKTGTIVDVDVGNFPNAKTSHLLPLPKSRPRYAERIKKVNQKVGKNKPWTRGLYESIIAVDLIYNQKNLEQRNRICLILLDSALEISFKEFLVHESGETYANTRLQNIFRERNQVENEVKRFIKDIDENIWKKIRYYYKLRCNLIHEHITSAVSDQQVEDYREIVQEVMERLFGLRFERETD